MVARAEALAKPLVIPTLLKQSVGAALITLVLTSLIVGIKTVDTNEALSFITRFPSVAWASIGVGLAYLGFGLVRSGLPLAALIASLAVAVAQGSVLLWGGPAKELYLPFEDPVVNWVVVIVAGIIASRAAVALHRGDSTTAAPASTALGDRIARSFNRASRLLGPLLIAFAVTMPFMPFANRRVVDVATLVATYVMLGWGLNVVVGLAGLLDLGYVAFYAVGAYTFALLARDLGFTFWEALPFCRPGGGELRHPPRVSGVAAARRLSRDRHARLWRDHPHRAAELGVGDRRAERHLGDPAAVLFRSAVRPLGARGASTTFINSSGSTSRPTTGSSFSIS